MTRPKRQRRPMSAAARKAQAAILRALYGPADPMSAKERRQRLAELAAPRREEGAQPDLGLEVRRG